MTRARSLVLAHLGQTASPCSALSTAQALQMDCDQATVYRALHWLESHGHIESFVLHCEHHGTERYYIDIRQAHRHWFHCIACHCFLDLGACTLDISIKQWEQQLGIAVQSHALQVKGLCSHCNALSQS